MTMDAIVNPNARRGRPLVIVTHGEGYGIGEATYGADRYRGLIRVYERTQRGRYHAEDHVYGDNSGLSGDLPYDHRSATRGGAPTSYGGGLMGAFDATRGAIPKDGPSIGSGHQVGIGAGAEEHLDHVDTGVYYQRNASLVAGLRVESRQDLAEVLNAATHVSPSWFWVPTSPNWYRTWHPAAVSPTAAQVPVAPQPHRPFGTNYGSSA